MGKKDKVSDSLRESLNDSEFKGQSYSVDKNLRKHGPLRTRKCTDCLFLIIFLAFLGAMVWCTMYGVSNGKPDELLSPVDEDSKLCGVTYPDYPYLYYLVKIDSTTPTFSTHAMCLSSCPTEETSTFNCVGTTQVS